MESITEEAHRLVSGDRGQAYGPPDVDYGRTAAIFNAMTGRDLTAYEGVQFMVAVKLSRMAVSPERRDHYVDAAGYVQCLWEVQSSDRA